MAKGSDTSVQQGNKDVLYPEPIVRPLPKPPELIDKTVEPKQSSQSDPNIDFEENSPLKKDYFGDIYKTRSNLF